MADGQRGHMETNQRVPVCFQMLTQTWAMLFFRTICWDRAGTHFHIAAWKTITGKTFTARKSSFCKSRQYFSGPPRGNGRSNVSGKVLKRNRHLRRVPKGTKLHKCDWNPDETKQAKIKTFDNYTAFFSRANNSLFTWKCGITSLCFCKNVFLLMPLSYNPSSSS